MIAPPIPAPVHVPTFEASPVIGNKTMLTCGRRIICPTCDGKRIVQEPFPQGCPLCRGTASVIRHDRLASVTPIWKKVKS